MIFAEGAVLLLAVIAIIILALAFREIYLSKIDIERKRRQIDHSLYEVLVLREISNKIGYELNIEKILEIILGSLNKLIPYSVAAFMLLRENEKVLYRVNLNEKTGREFIGDFKSRMLTVLNGQTKNNFSADDLNENLDGEVLDSQKEGKAMSFWTVPLVINNRGLGVMAVASYKSDLYTGLEMKVLEEILEQANQAVNRLEKLLESEKGKLGALVFSLIDGILMFDEKQNLIVANPAAQKLLSIIPHDGASIADAAHVLADKIDIRTKFEESVRGDRMVVHEDLLIKDRFFRLIITPVKNDFGQIFGGVILFHDTTPGKELERLREDFTAMMVHELRAPLTVVRGTANMFLVDPQLATKTDGKELLQTMYGSVETMLSLVNDMLDVSKIEAGRFQVDKSLNNICVVVKDKVTAFSTVAKTKNIEVVLELASCPEFLFDKLRISQVVNNLLSNAVKFTPEGGEIKVKISADSNAIKIDVTDTGEGMSQDKVNQLFSKFKQLGTNKDGGTGLGLVIAKGIIEAHGGKIIVSSQPGLGSTFSIILPVTV
ncbi:MAG: ATP-binding protein [bacterium]|nr:ATP-binding protein [bacterium]